MKLDHIPLDQLKTSKLNVRKKGGKEVADLVASIGAVGLLQPLLVRKNGEGFDIIAGQRRYNALVRLADEGNAEPVPCIIMEDGDDARAIESSLAENISRLPMEEIDQYKAFAALLEQGLPVADIASRFGVTERLVEQRLAIANIITPILNAYRRDEVRRDTLRTLTMATPRQQKAWWELFKSEDEHAPTGQRLKEWLFGGTEIPEDNALFDLKNYDGAIVADLFGEDRYFADTEKFWALQNAAIAARRQAYLDAGWSDVVVLDVGEHFASWNFVKTAKKKGGKVFIITARDGDVSFEEGYLSQKDAKLRNKPAEEDELSEAEPEMPPRSELTKSMRNYLGLHRHAAVRTELLYHPKLAMRLVVAHIVAGSSLWSVTMEEQKADSDAIAESLSQANAQSGFDAERGRILALLGFDGEDVPASLTKPRHGVSACPDIGELFYTLTILDDEQVLRVLTFAMAETLAAHTEVIDTLGKFLDIDMRAWWTPDQTFLDLMRDKGAINAMLREVAGDATADAHITSTAKVQKKIIADCLSGDGRKKLDGWLPRYMAFPAGNYVGSGSTGATIGSDENDGDIAEEFSADIAA